MDKDKIIIALVAYAGPLDDPRIGWVGAKPSTNDHFQCERCGEESLDCWEIKHKEGCEAKALLDQLKSIKDWAETPKPTTEG